MAESLAEMFNATIRPQDRLLLLPVYDAGGTADRSINSDVLAARVPRSVLVKDLDEAYSWISSHKDGFAAFATCGARDPELPGLARRLARGFMV